MKNIPQTIIDYLNIRDEINDDNNIVGFVSKNGKRLIIKEEYCNEKIYVLSNKLKIVRILEEKMGEPMKIKPIDVLKGYCDNADSVKITDIEIFKDISKAIEWLMR